MSTSNSFEVVTKKLSIPHKFACFWKNGKSCTDLLVLDFNPIIETFDLSGHYCLVHFQARPKPLRTWEFIIQEHKNMSQ